MSRNDKSKKTLDSDVKSSSSGLDEKLEETKDQLKKALADYQNLKKDMDKRLEFERGLIRATLLKRMIELSDDIDVAIDHVRDEKGWREGVTQILEKSRNIITDMGAELIDTKTGDDFDPGVHEAVAVAHGGEDGTISKVLQNGYRIGDMIIRPARVIVYKK